MFSVTRENLGSVRSHCDSLQGFFFFVVFLYVSTFCSTKISGLELFWYERNFLCWGELPVSEEMYQVVHLLKEGAELWETRSAYLSSSDVIVLKQKQMRGWLLLLFIGTSKATSELNVEFHFRATTDVHVTSSVKVHLRFIGSNCIKSLWLYLVNCYSV